MRWEKEDIFWIARLITSFDLSLLLDTGENLFRDNTRDSII